MSSTRCALKQCMVEKRDHGIRWIAGLGRHTWVAPDKIIIAERLREKYGVSNG